MEQLYLSVDIETTGLGPDSKILEVAFIPSMNLGTKREKIYEGSFIFPPLHIKVTEGPNAKVEGEPYALAMNSKLLKDISDKRPENLEQHFSFNTEISDIFNNNSTKPRTFYLTHEGMGAMVNRYLNKLKTERILWANRSPIPQQIDPWDFLPIIISKNPAALDVPMLTKYVPYFSKLVKHYHLDVTSLFFAKTGKMLGMKKIFEFLNLANLEVKHSALDDAYDNLMVISKLLNLKDESDEKTEKPN